MIHDFTVLATSYFFSLLDAIDHSFPQTSDLLFSSTGRVSHLLMQFLALSGESAELLFYLHG